jgi:hypothetical protein
MHTSKLVGFTQWGAACIAALVLPVPANAHADAWRCAEDPDLPVS